MLTETRPDSLTHVRRPVLASQLWAAGGRRAGGRAALHGRRVGWARCDGGGGGRSRQWAGDPT